MAAGMQTICNMDLEAGYLMRGCDLSLGYGGRVLARGFSVDIRRGEILGIAGPNGCGKTTLLRTVLGLMKPLQGRVEWSGNATVSYMPQRERLDTIVPITALEVVLMGRAAAVSVIGRTGRKDQEEALHALELLGITGLRDRLFRELSGGQQQKVLLARALAATPDVLVLDEPTAGMDVASEAAMIDFLGDLNRDKGVTILIVTHMLPVILNLATSILLMSPRGILHGAVDEVLREDRLSDLYGVPVHLGRVAGQRTLAVDHRSNQRSDAHA
jgi:ABC-type Mn2+/Zn2+ transport system ATPase subunit